MAVYKRVRRGIRTSVHSDEKDAGCTYIAKRVLFNMDEDNNEDYTNSNKQVH